MKKIGIYYFSGTGNSWWIAKEIQKELEYFEKEVFLKSIEGLEDTNLEEEVSKLDHIIIGFPVYGSNAPKIMQEFIEDFPKSKVSKPVSLFATQALASGDTTYFIGEILKNKGYKLMQNKHFRMMNNFHVPKFKFYKPKNNEKLYKLLDKNKDKVYKFSREIVDERIDIKGNNFVCHAVGNLQRKHVDSVEKTIEKEFTVLKERCIKCRKCIKVCPVNNIEMGEETPVFRGHCIVCLRCYSQCPKFAILIGEGTKDIKKYPRYKGPDKNFDINLVRK